MPDGNDLESNISQSNRSVPETPADIKVIRILEDYFSMRNVVKISFHLKGKKPNLLHTLYSNYKILPDFLRTIASNNPILRQTEILAALGLPSGQKLIDLAIQTSILSSVFVADYYKDLDYSLAIYGLIQRAEPLFDSVLSTLQFDMAMTELVKDFAGKLETGRRPKGLQGIAAQYSIEYLKKNGGMVNHSEAVAILAQEKAEQR